MTDYMKYRGKCKEYVDRAIKEDSSLKAVRGHYNCPLEGLLTHWWCIRKDGTIYDPTKKQFLSKGVGEYIPFDGYTKCAECNKKVKEEEVNYYYGNYAYCSYKCNLKHIGLGNYI